VTATRGALLAVGLGALAVIGATIAGTSGAFLDDLVHPIPIVRAALVGVSAALAVILLTRGLTRLSEGRTDVPGMIRGVRLVFLALAAASAGMAWILADPLPLIVAMVIAGIDVLETSFLLLVVASGQVNRRP
jgi:hypothetical protein